MIHPLLNFVYFFHLLPILG